MLPVQLPNRAAPDPTATEDEYRDWSEDESSQPVDDQVVRPEPFACTMRSQGRHVTQGKLYRCRHNTFQMLWLQFGRQYKVLVAMLYPNSTGAAQRYSSGATVSVTNIAVDGGL